MERFPHNYDPCFSAPLTADSIKAICTVALRVRVEGDIVKVVPLEQGTYNYTAVGPDGGPDPSILQFNCKDINASGIFRPGSTTSAMLMLYDDYDGALSNLTTAGPNQISLAPGTSYTYPACTYNYTVTQGCVFGINAPAGPAAACPVGYYKKTGIFNNSFCAPCPAGTYADTVGAACKPCPPGTSNPFYGGTNCTKCGRATYAPTEGTTNCQDCGASSHKWTDGIQCSQCPRGSFVAPDGKPQCVKCQAGKKCCTVGWGGDCPKCAAGSSASAITSAFALESATPSSCLATAQALCTPKMEITVDSACSVNADNGISGHKPDNSTGCGWSTKLPVQGPQLSLADLAKFDYTDGNNNSNSSFLTTDISILPSNYTSAASPYLEVYIPSTKCTLRYRALTAPVAALLGAAPKPGKATTCPAGQYLEAATDTKPGPCLPCPPGSYSPSRSRASACTPCPAGTYANHYASTKCKKCPAAQVSDRGSATCRTCFEGLPNPAGTACDLCPNATYGAGPRCLGNPNGNICCSAGDCKGQVVCEGPLVPTGYEDTQYYSAVFQVTSQKLPQPACKNASMLSCVPLNGKFILSSYSSTLLVEMDPLREGLCSNFTTLGAFRSTKSAAIRSFDFTVTPGIEAMYGLLSDSSRGTVNMYLSSFEGDFDNAPEFPAKASPECSVTLKLLSGYAFDLKAPQGAACDPIDAVITYQGRKFCRPCFYGQFANSTQQCEWCPDGSYGDAIGSSTCKPCLVGYSCSHGFLSACSGGSYSSKPNQAACASCPANTYGSRFGDGPTSQCTPCPKGTTAPQGAPACTVPWDTVFPA